MKRKRIEVVFVAALFAAALAFVACKNIEDGGEIQQPPAPEQGASGGSQGEGQPGGGDNTGNEGENPDEGGDEGDEQNPPQPSGKTVVELMKEIIGESDYDAISAEVAAGNMTLTEEKIKAVGDIFPALEKDAESGKEAKDVENAEIIRQNKEAFVAQAQGEMEDVFKTIYPEGYEEYPFLFDEDDFERKYVVTYKKDFTFEGAFNLDEIDIMKADGSQGNFSNATLTNGGSKILIDKLNDIRGSSLPTLVFNKTNYNISDDSSAKETYALYKAYSKELVKLQLKGDLHYDPIDGKKISGDSNYTLFENGGNTAKSADNGTIKSLTVDTLVQMTKQLKIYKFYNMIISDEATKTATVNWELRNIVFEEDMSTIKNNFKNPNGRSLPLYGIVYFKKKPYNNKETDVGQAVYGMLKLDNLENVSSENFRIGLSHKFSVLDIRGVDTSFLNTYTPKNKEIILDGGYTHAIYFSKSYSTLKDNQTEIDKLCGKFFPAGAAGIINAYLGDTKVKGNSFYGSASDGLFSAASRAPRTLKEFEDLGNSYEEFTGNMQFEHSAKSSYTSDELNKLDEIEKKSLSEDESNKMLAKNDRRCCKAKSFV